MKGSGGSILSYSSLLATAMHRLDRSRSSRTHSISTCDMVSCYSVVREKLFEFVLFVLYVCDDMSYGVHLVREVFNDISVLVLFCDE